MVTVSDWHKPIWWGGTAAPPPAAWHYVFDQFTDDDSAEEWGLAAGIFVAQFRRRHSRGPTFRELFLHLLPESDGVPAVLPSDWDVVERRSSQSAFRLHCALEWRRRGFIGFERGVKHSLRVGRRFRELSRSRQLVRAADRARPQNSSLGSHQSSERMAAGEVSLNGLTAAEVMDRLQITPRYLKRLSEGGYLHAVVHQGERYFPRWQFCAGRSGAVVPGIQMVSSSIPAAWTLDRIREYMHEVNPLLEIGGERLSPVEWLLRGGDPISVVAALRERST